MATFKIQIQSDTGQGQTIEQTVEGHRAMASKVGDEGVLLILDDQDRRLFIAPLRHVLYAKRIVEG